MAPENDPDNERKEPISNGGALNDPEESLWLLEVSNSLLARYDKQFLVEESESVMMEANK